MKHDVIAKIWQQCKCQSTEEHLHKAFLIIPWNSEQQRSRATHSNMDASHKCNVMCKTQVTQNIYLDPIYIKSKN